MTSLRLSCLGVALLLAIGVAGVGGCNRQPKVTLPVVPPGAVDAHAEPQPPDLPRLDAGMEPTGDMAVEPMPDRPPDTGLDMPEEAGPDGPPTDDPKPDSPAPDGPPPDEPPMDAPPMEAPAEVADALAAEPPPAACVPAPASVPKELSYDWTEFPSGSFGYRYDQAGPLATGPEGDIYVGGWYAYDADFDPTSTGEDLHGSASGQCWIVRLGPDGSYKGSRFFGTLAAPLGCELTGLDVGPGGEMAVSGHFIGSAFFDPAYPAYGTVTTAKGTGHDGFVSKFDKDFNYLWTRFMSSGDTVDRAIQVAVGLGGVVAAVGYFEGTCDFGVGPPPVSYGKGDIFAVKYDAVGTPAWVYTAGGSEQDQAMNAAFAPDGSLAVVGTFRGIGRFTPTLTRTAETTKTSTVSSDGFVLRLSTAGELSWVRTFGGEDVDDVVYGVTVQSTGTVLATGGYRGKADLRNDGSVKDFKSSASNTLDAFLMRILPDGAYCRTITWGGGGQDAGFEVEVASDDSIRVAGSFSSTVDFDPSPTFTAIRSAVAGDDPFVSGFASDGTYYWTWVGAGASVGGAWALGMLPDGGVVIWGSHTVGAMPFDFDPAGSGDYQKGDGDDMYITALRGL